MLVKATREGLAGQRTATGYIIDARLPFVALPATKALYKFVRLTNPANAKTCVAVVMDVGPWNEHDDDYVLNGARPAAESGVSVSGHGTNGAGIDLSEAVWRALGLLDNAKVEWDFIA
jgi:hypothetical protein